MTEKSTPFIVNACLTGMVARKEHNPHVPMTPKEIAEDVEACVELGASIVHVHARDDDGNPDWRPGPYSEILAAIRSVSEDVIVCVSTSGREVNDVERRAACMDAEPRPDMGSLTLGSINFLHEGVINSPSTVRELAQRMAERNIQPELEIFDIGMARTAKRLIADGTLEPPVYANVLLGNVATAGTSPSDLAALLAHLPEEVTWCCAGVAGAQRKANAMGLIFGDGVRVGLEDNLYLDADRTPATNPALVERVVQLGRLLGRRPATIAEVRERLSR